ncbi:hypothetical protein JOS77_28850 [Chromobacterium haemolyticum]|nr:hypothetical protein JOS77_28850 [Chromobacterium haemolyticum]
MKNQSLPYEVFVVSASLKINKVKVVSIRRYFGFGQTQSALLETDKGRYIRANKVHMDLWSAIKAAKDKLADEEAKLEKSKVTLEKKRVNVERLMKGIER